MVTSEKGLALIKEFEGCVLHAYRDIVGIWTIGYGHIGGVKEHQSITEGEAEVLLRGDLIYAEKCVNRYVRGIQISQGQFDAMVSFVFNLGCDSLRRSTLLVKLLDGDDNGASAEFQRWNKAGGRVSAGLTRRRQAEAELFRSVD